MKVVYGVRWIEIDFGERPEGWKLFLDKETCIQSTKLSSEKGAYADGGGYFGPERPLSYFEIPYDSLDKESKSTLKNRNDKTSVCFTDNHWEPKFKSECFYIK